MVEWSKRRAVVGSILQDRKMPSIAYKMFGDAKDKMKVAFLFFILIVIGAIGISTTI